MSGVKNLIPLTKQTKDKQKEIRTKGGIRSGEVRREKRDIKRNLEIGLEFLTKKTFNRLKSEGEYTEAEIIADIGIAAYSVLKIAVSEKANDQIKLSAWKEMWDRIEGKPVNKSIIDANVKTETTSLSEEESKIIESQIKKEADKLRK